MKTHTRSKKFDKIIILDTSNMHTWNMFYYDILVVCLVVKGDQMTSGVLEDGNKEMFSKK